MTETAVKTLLNQPTTVTLSPSYEGANIGTVIGFKHVNYLVEKAVIEHFRRSGLPVGGLYETHAIGFDVVSIDSRLHAALVVDDEAVVTVDPVTKDGASELSFKVSVSVQREGELKKAVTASVRAVLRLDEDDQRVAHREPVTGGLEQFVVPRIGGAAPGDEAPGDEVAALGPALLSGASTDSDPVLDQLLAGRNGYAWKVRVPYTLVHFFERLQMSGYLRLMEEAKHRFVDSRGISIRSLLTERNWIPLVSHSTVTMLDEALLEEDLYVVYTVQDLFKDLLYTARVDYYVVRDGRLVQTATGTITHGYGVPEDNGKGARLVGWDDKVSRAFRGERGQA